MDEAIYREAVNPQMDRDVMVDKKMMYVLDSNGGNYNGVITFDTSSLANSGMYLDWSSSYMVIPFVISARSTVDITAINEYSLGMKNGFWNIVDSLSIEYNNSSVVQLQPFLNFYVNYKVASSFSADDLKKWGPSIGYCPDTAGNHVFNNAANAGGDGYSNNDDLPLPFFPTSKTNSPLSVLSFTTCSLFPKDLYPRIPISLININKYYFLLISKKSQIVIYLDDVFCRYSDQSH